MSVNYNKCPFPWFGGKQHAAPLIWEALGDVAHYVEPFAGSIAALLCRPHLPNRTYYSETVNDVDGLLCNAWRAIALAPDAVAEAASWPVSEVDLMARHLWLVKWINDPDNVGRLRADPSVCDPIAAGYWLWGQSSWIGSGWCSGTGPWCVDEQGVVRKQGRGSVREAGVKGERPHITDNGQGVNRPQLREPGVASQRPHLSNNGQGVSHAGLREPGVASQLPHLGDDGKGVNRPQLREPGVAGDERNWHPMTMPELRSWMRYLSARLRHVRILCGDWTRAVTDGACKTLPVRQAKGYAGVFLDPPYSGDARDRDLYAHDSNDIAKQVREWCLAKGDDPKLRIVLAGFSGEGHEALCDRGWREIEWFAKGFLRGGMGNTSKTGEHQQKRERLWLSPHTLAEVPR